MKKRVTGLGGVFFKTRDPEGMKAWHNKRLKLDAGEHGAMFKWRDRDKPKKEGNTVWSPFPEDTSYLQPAKKDFILEVLKNEGVEIVGKMESYPYGKFGWIMDPEGNKIELWEPADEKTL